MLWLAWVVLVASPLCSSALVLQSAELVHGFTILLLHFDSQATVYNTSDANACEGILSAATVGTIGTLPSCAWLRDGQVFQVILGDEPTVAIGQVVSTQAVLAAKGAENATATSLSATVTSQLQPVAPTALLQVWPPEATDCTSVVLSGARSWGALGRRLRAAWRFGAVEVSAIGLEPYLTAATAANAMSLELPSAAIRQAVFGTPASVKLEVVLEVTNWLGLSSTATEVLTIDRSSLERPLVFPTSSTNRTIQSNQAVSFSIATRYADKSSCGQAVTLPSSLTESWSVLNGSSWMPLETVWVDLAREPWKVSLGAYVLAPGSVHQLKASAAFGSAAREQVFDLQVVEAEPPMVYLSGPYAVTETCGFSLHALAWDPLAPTTENLIYWWSCATLNAAYDCRRLANFGPQVWILKNGTGSSGSDLIVDGSQLLGGNYSFTLQVIRSSDSATVTASWTVEVAMVAKASIDLTPSWHEGEAISIQPGNVMPLCSAALQTGSGCSTKDANWSWALVGATSPFSIITILNSSADMTFSGNEVLYNYLLPGVLYSYAMVEEVEPMPTTLVEAEASGLVYARTVPFLADAPPAGGLLTCLPMLGTAASTEFFITTSNWHDEDMANLSYSFYRFPLPAGLTLADDGAGGITVSGDFTPPEVEWKDTSSPNHWLNLGGKCMGHSQLPLQLMLPAGQHMLAVVVQDTLGAVTSKFLAGPLVTAAPSVSAIQLGLDISVVSNNADIILSTLDAITELDVSLEVQALTTAAATMDLSETGVCQMARVVHALLENAAPATAHLIARAMSTVLVDMARIPSEAVDRMLRVVWSIASAYKQEVEEVVLRSEQLVSLVAQLGDAILATVPRGGSRRLSYMEGAQGLEVFVAKREASDLPYEGLAAGGVVMPPYTFQTDGLVSYLLEAPACDSADLQITTWIQSNPYAWSNKSSLTATLVAADATVTMLQLRHCLSDDLLNLTTRSLVLELPLPARPTTAAPEGYVYRACCAIFDPVQRHWTRDGVTWEELSETIKCTVESGVDATMAFTTFYRPVVQPEEQETVNVGIMIVAIIAFFCLGGVAYSNSGPKKVSPEPPEPEPPGPLPLETKPPQPEATVAIEPELPTEPPGKLDEPEDPLQEALRTQAASSSQLPRAPEELPGQPEP